MIIGTQTVANPTQIQKTSAYITSGNQAHGGVKRYFHHRMSAPGKVLRVYRVQITWTGLSTSEYNALQNAHMDTFFDYVALEVDGLGINQGGTNRALVTADSQQYNLSHTTEQGFFGETGEGPILHNAVASYITQIEEVDPPA